MIGYILAIGAAATWSMVALSATRIVRYFGSYNYNLLRLIGIIILFLPYVVINWDAIYNLRIDNQPYTPKVEGEGDTSNFDAYADEEDVRVPLEEDDAKLFRVFYEMQKASVGE